MGAATAITPYIRGIPTVNYTFPLFIYSKFIPQTSASKGKGFLCMHFIEMVKSELHILQCLSKAQTSNEEHITFSNSHQSYPGSTGRVKTLASDSWEV